MSITRQEPAIRRKHHSAAPVTLEVVAGAAAGAAAGSVGGPPGMAVGAAVGVAIGAMAGLALRRAEVARIDHDEALDKEIGVIGGDLGAAPPDAPPPRIGAYHAASIGVGAPTQAPAEGAIENLDDE